MIFIYAQEFKLNMINNFFPNYFCKFAVELCTLELLKPVKPCKQRSDTYYPYSIFPHFTKM